MRWLRFDVGLLIALTLHSLLDRFYPNALAFFNPYIMPQDSGRLVWRRTELGGSNGHGNARSVAAIQSVLSNGGEARGG